MHLDPGQCYGFKIPLVPGGKYELSNVEPTGLAVHYSFLADIYKQTKDVPDGARIKVVVIVERKHQTRAASHVHAQGLWYKLLSRIVSASTEAVIWLGMRL